MGFRCRKQLECTKVSDSLLSPNLPQANSFTTFGSMTPADNTKPDADEEFEEMRHNYVGKMTDEYRRFLDNRKAVQSMGEAISKLDEAVDQAKEDMVDMSEFACDESSWEEFKELWDEFETAWNSLEEHG